MARRLTFLERKRWSLKIYWLVLLNFFLIFKVFSQDYNSLPYSQISYYGEPRFLLIDLSSGDTINKPYFTIKEECNPCKFKLQFNTFYTRANLQLLVIEGPQDIVLKEPNDLIRFKPDAPNLHSCFVYNLARVSSGEFVFEVFSKPDTFLRIFTLNSIDYEILFSDSENATLQSFDAIYLGFLGGLCILFLLNLVNYLITKRYEFLHYSLYVLGLFVFFFAPILTVVVSTNTGSSLDQYDIWTRFMRSVSQPLFYVFYFRFIIHFLKTEFDYPFLHRLLLYVSNISIATALILSTTILFGIDSLTTGVFTIYRLLLAVVSLYLIIYAYFNAKDQYAIIISSGSLILLIFTLLNWIFSIKMMHPFSIPPMGYFIIGVTGELLLFSIGLALKTKSIEIEKNSYSEQLILNNEKLLNIEKQKSEQLELVIKRKSKEIEKQVSHRVKNEYNFRVKKLEQEALFAQMNPHFIFNSLNNLKSYIIQDKKDVASQYLYQLSIFFRQILNIARKSTILISDEIEFLRLYIDLENHRKNNRIHFEVDISHEEEVSAMRIPTMILQPILENSIVHGRQELDEKINIFLSFELKEDVLKIEVKDNGRGISESSNLSSHASLSTKITIERLRILYGDKAYLSMDNSVIHDRTTGVITSINIPL